MAQELLQGGLGASALSALLSRWGLVQGPPTPPSLAEGLSRWVGWADAIPLSAALQGATPAPAPAGARRTQAAARLDAELARLRSELHFDHTVARRAARPGSRSGAAAPPDEALDVDDHRQRYLLLQQTLQTRVAVLREQARRALVAAGGELARLASLDGVMESVLKEREQSLLALMPSMLEARFRQLHRSATAADPDAAAGPKPQATPWLDAFREDAARLLRAELELRLQPVQGLLEALRGDARDDHE